jgi:hypothetical protein
MADTIVLNPSDGLRNVSIYPTDPATEAAAREQFMNVIEQIVNQSNLGFSNITNVIPVKLSYDTGSATTNPAFSFTLPSKGIYLIGATVYGQNKDPNHIAGGLWLVKYDGGGTYTILSSELLGTVHKAGNALSLSVGAPSTAGIVRIDFSQTNSTLAKFNVIYTKVGGI